MSVYLVKGKGWKYDFTMNGIRYTEAWFKTKQEAKQAEAKRKEEITNPKPEMETPTDMEFLTELYLHSIRRSERAAMPIYEEQLVKDSHTDSHTESQDDLTVAS